MGAGCSCAGPPHYAILSGCFSGPTDRENSSGTLLNPTVGHKAVAVPGKGLDAYKPALVGLGSFHLKASGT